MREKREGLQAQFLHECAEERHSVRTDIVGLLVYRCLPEQVVKRYSSGTMRTWGCQNLVLFGAFDTFFLPGLIVTCSHVGDRIMTSAWEAI